MCVRDCLLKERTSHVYMNLRFLSSLNSTKSFIGEEVVRIRSITLYEISGFEGLRSRV